MNSKNHYLDIFNVTETGLKEITAKALSRGGDFADLYFEYTTFFNLNLRTESCPLVDSTLTTE